MESNAHLHISVTIKGQKLKATVDSSEKRGSAKKVKERRGRVD